MNRISLRRTLALLSCLIAFSAQAHADLEVESLVRQLAAKDDGFRARALSRLGGRGPSAGGAVPAVSRCLDDPSPSVRRTAAAVLPRLGPGATAAVLDVLRREDPELREACLRGLATLRSVASELMPGLVPLLRGDPGARWIAARVLGRVGAPAAIHLVEGLEDQETGTRNAIMHALTSVGAPAVEHLEKALAHESVTVRADAALVLGVIGGSSRQALPALTALLRDADPPVRREAARALGRIGGEGVDVSALASMLEDPEREVREAAAQSLVAVGLPAVAGLRDSMASEDMWTRRFASWALRSIAPEDPVSKRVLLTALEDKEVRVQLHAAAALRRCPDELGAALAVLGKGIGHPEADVRRRAASAFGDMGTVARELLPRVVSLLEDPEPEVRVSAALALGSHGPGAEVALPALRPLIHGSTAEVGVAAASAIVRIRPGDAAARQVLILNLMTEGVPGRWANGALVAAGADAVSDLIGTLGFGRRAVAASRVLVEIGDAARQPLIEFVSDPNVDSKSRAQAAGTLAEIAPEDAEAQKALVECLLHEHDRGEVAAALLRLGDLVLPALDSAIRGPDEPVAISAACVSAQISPDAGLPYSRLLEALFSKNGEAQCAAAWWLKTIPPPPADAIPTLDTALEAAGPHWIVRLYLLQTLGRMGRAGVPALVRALGAEDHVSRAEAAEVLAGLGPEAATAVPALHAALGPGSPHLRAWAARALIALGEHPVDAMLALTSALAEKEEGWTNYRHGAPKAVEKLVEDAGATLREGILTLVADESTASYRRVCAIGALAWLKVEVPVEVAALGEALGSEDPKVRRAVLERLEALEGAAAELVPRLLETLRDGEKEERLGVLDALRRLGPADGATVGAISGLLEEEDLDTRIAAALTLHHVQPESRRALAMLLGLLDSEDAPERAAAARAIGEIGEAAEAVLVERLDDPRPHVRAGALAALGQMSPLPFELLRRVFAKAGPDVRWRIAGTLRAGPGSPRTGVAILLLALADEDPRVRQVAALAIARSGQALLKELENVIQNGEAAARRCAVQAVEHMDSAYPARAALLAKALTDKEPRVRCAAAYALIRLHRYAAPSLKTLETMSREDESEDVRAAAEAALLRLSAKR